MFLELGAVDPDDRLAALADLGAQRGHPLLDIRLVRAPAQEVGVRAEAVDSDPGVADPARERVAARGERVRPAPGEEAEPVRAEHAAQHGPRDVVGEHPEVLRRRPRGVREVPDPQVGAQLAEHAGDQHQVVVLHDHRGALGRLGRQRLGEGPVVRLVGRPLAPELRVEHRLQRRLVQHVVDEPQHRVRDAVVGVGVDLGRDVEHPHAVLADPAPHRLAVAVAERGAHPQRARVRPDRRQSGHQSAAAPLGVQRTVVANLVGDGATVGGHQYLCST
ncbi:hypothetical protein SGLAM104S_00763 [Streptomyces glaucescens]